MRPWPDPPPDPFDAGLSAIHTAVDSLGPWLAIWQARYEPDAHARRCAADTIDAIDRAFTALHSIRAELVSQVRRADDEAAARADELLARMREGPDAAAARPQDRTATTHADPAPAQAPKS